jgi:streptogramin lyase
VRLRLTVTAATLTLAVLAGCGDDGSGDRAGVVFEREVGSNPGDVAVAEGVAWVTDAEDATLSRVDPDSGEVITVEGVTAVGEADVFSTIEPGPGTPDAVAATEGAVWVTDQIGGAVTVVRVDPVSGEVEETFATGTGGGRGDVAATREAIWVQNGSEADGFTVTRLDAGTGEIVDTVTVSETTTSVAATDDAAWTATSGGSLIRIDPETLEETEVAELDGVTPIDLAAVDGALWLADAEGGALVRVDPDTGEVVDTIDVDDDLTAVAASEDELWATFGESGTVRRIAVGG